MKLIAVGIAACFVGATSTWAASDTRKIKFDVGPISYTHSIPTTSAALSVQNQTNHSIYRIWTECAGLGDDGKPLAVKQSPFDNVEPGQTAYSQLIFMTDKVTQIKCRVDRTENY